MRALGNWFLALSTLACFSCSGEQGCADSNALNYDAEASEGAVDCAYPDRAYAFPVFFFTSTQSAASGAFSLPFFQTLDMNNAQFIPVSVHGQGSDPLYSAAAPSILAAYSVGSVPNFCVGPNSPSNVAGEVEGQISAQLTESADVGLQAKALNLGGDSVAWELFGYRYRGLPESAFVNVYALVAETLMLQAGAANQPERHYNVLAEHAAASGLGNEVLFSSSGNPAFKTRLSMLRPTGPRRYLAVVWLAQGNNYRPANAVWVNP
jgi:hypothetical protein